MSKIIKADNWDGKSRPSNKAYDESWNRIFGKKENDELAESYKQSVANKKERDQKRTYEKRKDHATDISYENEK